MIVPNITTMEKFMDDCLYGGNQYKLDFIHPGVVEIFVMVNSNEYKYERLSEIIKEQYGKSKYKKW